MKIESVVRSIKLPSSINRMLTNKLLQTIVDIMSALSILGYVALGQFDNVVLFGLIAMLMSIGTHNRMLLLGIPLLLVSMRNMKEGLEGMSDEETKKKKAKEKELKAKKAHADATSTATEDELEPASDTKTRPRIDYATTMEEAYGNLNGVLGEKGIKQLTADTQNLMNQQLQLAKSMEAMTPLIEGIMPMAEKAQKMIEQMETSTGMNGGLASITEMAKQLTSKMK